MYIYTDYENQVIFLSYDSCRDSVENNAVINGQLKILDFQKISRHVWKLEVPKNNKEVFHFIVVQINTILGPNNLSSEAMAFCKAVSDYEKAKPVMKEDHAEKEKFRSCVRGRK